MISYIQLQDHELVSLLKAGDRLAFNEIYNRYVAYAYRFAFNILDDEDECADALQEIFVWLWHNRALLNITNLKSYLTAAVKYKLVRVIQSSRRRSEILAKIPSIPEDVIDNSFEVKELQNIIKQFIETLPPKAREIFHLSRNEYLTNKEIAERMDISEKTVENQMTISLKKLRLNLGRMSFWSIFI